MRRTRLRVPVALAVTVLVGGCPQEAPRPDAHIVDASQRTADAAAEHDASPPVDAGTADVPMG